MDMQISPNVQVYLNHLKADYAKWIERAKIGLAVNKDDTSHMDDMKHEFNMGLKAIEGSKYIKVITENSTHSFIVKADGPKFNAGDVLMAKSYKAPATNFARGNIYTENFSRIRWSGCC